MKAYSYFLIVILFCLIVGCSSNKDDPTTLFDKYSGKLENVNKVTITSGSTGEKKEIDDQEAINVWINEVKDIVLYPLVDQEERDGFLYAISLYENDIKKLAFSLGYIDKVYYDVDDKMLELTTQLFESN